MPLGLHSRAKSQAAGVRRALACAAGQSPKRQAVIFDRRERLSVETDFSVPHFNHAQAEQRHAAHSRSRNLLGAPSDLNIALARSNLYRITVSRLRLAIVLPLRRNSASPRYRTFRPTCAAQALSGESHLSGAIFCHRFSGFCHDLSVRSKKLDMQVHHPPQAHKNAPK